MGVRTLLTWGRAALGRRALWVARYRDGREVVEGACDWLDLPQAGLVEVRLHCPDGRVAVRGNSAGIDGRAFQFKSGGATVGGQRWCDFQVIGLVTDLDGGAWCAAWEYAPCRLVEFRDNVAPGRWQYGGVPWAFQWDHLGARPA